jgi:4-amino-4-deoxy-L-arabinose transferase-like glycosyltransferase
MPVNKFKSLFSSENIFVLLILIVALILRVYKIGTLLDFHYDQGRDAMVIWNLWHEGKFFLIGPTTGIEGVFRGPWYYWLIAPFYLLGKGNPVFPSVFLSITSVVACWFTYILGKKVGGKWTGFAALIIASFSAGIVGSSRWLSNPTPMFLISVGTLWSLYLYSQGKKWALILTGLLAGLAMQFGSAAEIFYFPAILIYLFLGKKKFPGIKIGILGILAVVVAFIPQILFDFRHQGILGKGIINFVFNSQGSSLSFFEIVKLRLSLYWEVFSQNLWLKNQKLLYPFVGIALYGLFSNFKNLWKNEVFKIVFIFTLCPLLGLLFFKGNNGIVYGYYLTGYFLIFILLFSSALGSLGKYWLGKTIISSFLIFLVLLGGLSLKTYFTKSQDAPDTINLANQKRAIDEVYRLAEGKQFNLDVYVPPVIPHSYNYLLTWYGQGKYGYLPQSENIPSLYTLYEIDPPHPERLEAWLKRQEGIGKVLDEKSFGGIVVQKRLRVFSE